MSAKPDEKHGPRVRGWAARVALIAGMALPGLLRAQAPEAPLPVTLGGEVVAQPAAEGQAIFDPMVQPARGGCASCCSPLTPPEPHLPCYDCCRCLPGRDRAYCGFDCEPKSWLGRAIMNTYECVCCPDPCYEGRWLAVADSAFFQDAFRPVTQQRIRTDFGYGFPTPDRAEWFWARQRTNPNQVGPGGPWAPNNAIGKGPPWIAAETDYSELSWYLEVAKDAFSFFIEVPYRSIDPETAPASLALIPPALACPHSGFADMNLGTKSMIVDREVWQLTFQFKTFIPVGQPSKGLGTGHVSLEPSLLWGLCLGPATYLQAMTAYWIPIGGDQIYQSNVLHGHVSLNHILWSPGPALKLIGVIELNGWHVFDGAYTDPTALLIDQNGFLAPVAAPGETNIFSAGPGIRWFVCDKADIGVGSAFAFTGTSWADQLIRAELRFRF